MYTVRIFTKCTHVCAVQTTYLFLIEPDFPCLADKIAEPRPNMNIKVVAFTVSEKSINTTIIDHPARKTSRGSDTKTKIHIYKQVYDIQTFQLYWDNRISPT